MKPNTFSPKRQEAGVALLISIFILLLVSGVALALVANSGTETSLAGNYRSSTSAYDAGFAGLEEARGRLLPGSPNSLIPAVIPAGVPLTVNQVYYILNPLVGEAVAPTNLGNNATYPDTEYAQEFPPLGLAGAIVQTTPSVWANSAVLGMPGPLYKWVRITAATEQSLNIDVNRDGKVDGKTPGTVATPLYYDAAPANGAKPSMIEVPVGGVPPATASQVFEVTALAALPNGTRKLEQYVVTPVTLNLNFPSALTLGGKVGTFVGANSNPYQVDGTDGSGNAPAVAGCNPNPATSLPAIGVTDPAGSTTDKTTVVSGIPRPTHYTGGGLTTPSVGEVTLNSTLSTPAELNQLVQTITQNADAVLNPPAGTSATSSQLPPSSIASPCTPSTVVVNGDFDLGPNTGCGLLVVTGNFLYQGNSGWNGIILVIGSGTTTFQGNGGGSGQFDGAIFVATTKNAAGNLLPTLGTVNFDISGGGGNGIYYNSCWVNRVQQPPSYKVLSFHEIAQ